MCWTYEVVHLAVYSFLVITLPGHYSSGLPWQLIVDCAHILYHAHAPAFYLTCISHKKYFDLETHLSYLSTYDLVIYNIQLIIFSDKLYQNILFLPLIFIHKKLFIYALQYTARSCWNADHADCRLCRPCRLCRLSVIFFYLYLNFLVKFLL